MNGEPVTGVDVGGTFTDLATWDGSVLVTSKVPSTPRDQSGGVMDALHSAGVRGSALLHGTTVATNAILERSGARTALVTDAGFEDVLEIGRQVRPSLYDPAETRAAPLAPAELRFGLAGRDGIDSTAPIDTNALVALAERVAASAPESVAVSTLYAFADSNREESVRQALSEVLPHVPVSLSSEVAPEFREYERASTTTLNAFLVPVVARYLSRLGEVVLDAGVVGAPAVMRSSGGLMHLADAARIPAAIVLSGPAGGVVAAGALGSVLGHRSIVSFDMGGTSTDVCRITDGRPEVSFERSVGDLPNRMPAVAIHTVGAGGGSIGWVDSGGALRVGPRSAGADPGPASYGRGGQAPTVTDADLLVGRLASAGALPLDVALATTALETIGATLGMSALETASGVVEVVEAHMERAVRAVSVEEGADPRSATLVAFGGAGAMHATALARRLDMAGVVVPPHAGVFSALGLLLAPPRTDIVQGILMAPPDQLDEAILGVAQRAQDDLEGTGSGSVHVETSADVRYRGQAHETSVTYEPGEGWDVLIDRFHETHRIRNGFARVDDPVEVVAVRAAAIGHPALTIDQLPAAKPQGVPKRGSRPAVTASGLVEAAVWWRPGLRPGDEIVGPAVVEEPEATTWLAPGERAVVDDLGALGIEW